MKNQLKEIKFFVLKNRSLAENDPKNLIGRGCVAVDDYLNENPIEDFCEMVNRILDDNE